MQWVPSPVRPITQPEWYIQVSPQARAAYLAQAILWEPPNIAEMTAERIRQGEPTSLQPDQDVSCTYLYNSSTSAACRGSSAEWHRWRGYRRSYRGRHRGDDCRTEWGSGSARADRTCKNEYKWPVFVSRSGTRHVSVARVCRRLCPAGIQSAAGCSKRHVGIDQLGSGCVTLGQFEQE